MSTMGAASQESTSQNKTPQKQRILLFIEYAYLMRFPVLAALVLSVGLPLGYYVSPAIFQGLFDAGRFWSFTFVVWLEFQLAWTIMVTSRLILLYGPDRFESLKKLGASEPKKLSILQITLFAALAFFPLATTWKGSLDLTTGAKLLATLAGFVISLGSLAMAAMMHFKIEHGGGRTAEVILPSFGLPKPPANDENWEKRRSSFWNWMDRQFAKIPAELTAGLVRRPGSRVFVRSGFELAFSAYVVLLATYLLIGIVYSPGVVSSAERRPAALFFALFLLILWTWLLSGASFILDRIRLPVLTTMLVLSIAFSFFHTDHQFKVVQTANHADLFASDVIRAWDSGKRGGKDKPLVVVATAGGGIQAAAWTTQVLTGLESECQKADFASSVVLISSVSGGSVGSMYFLAAYNSANGSYPKDTYSLRRVNYNSRRSSLSSVGWGLLYPDFLRTVPLLGLAVPQTFDRGWSIENAWVAGWKEPPMLSDWRSDVQKGLRPAAIFNATGGESGARFLVASTDLTSPGGIQFGRDFQGWDIPVATAARLSATFPYVSPMARATNGSGATRVHVADGGYYDNSGIVGALAWLEDGADQLRGRTVLFLTIDGSAGAPAEGQTWSWQRQMTSPVETMLHVRTSSQKYRGGIETNLLIDSLRKKGVNIIPVPFIYSYGGDAPLSWHLNRTQRENIGKAWTATNADSKKVVFANLGCSATQ